MDLSISVNNGRSHGSEEEEFGYMDQIVRKVLPSNYNFEIAKCIQRIRQIGANVVALQMPEGLLGWACEIADILRFFCDTLNEVIVMADVTYGACCIDDITAEAMGADLIIHYGHSCLVPVTVVSVQCLYVFVEIAFSPSYLAKVITDIFQPHDQIFLMGTIQYSNVLREACAMVDESGYFRSKIVVPQASPLLPGEVLGCTSPKLHKYSFEKNECFTSTCKDTSTTRESSQSMAPVDDVSSGACTRNTNEDMDTENCQHTNLSSDAAVMECCGEKKILFIADGRFHLESVLIHNPGIKAFRFDPFTKCISEESYDIVSLHSTRQDVIKRAKCAKAVCLVLSVLGRQGNINILKNLTKLLDKASISYHVRLLSEITLEKLADLDVDAYIQVGCPRLSIDWGSEFRKPILNPYEAYVVFNNEEYRKVYPMDYYANDGGEWSNYAANRNAAPIIDSKEAIRRRLQQRALQKQLRYST